MSQADLIKRYIKRRIMLPIIRGLKLNKSRSFTAIFNLILAILPFSEAARVRLKNDFLCHEQKSSSPLTAKAKGMEEVIPIPLKKIKGKLNKFTQSISFQRHASPLVSVIIPVYNQIEYTLCCLKSIADQPPDITYEIIVVDDCSSDRTPELLKKIPGLILISNPKNLNFLRSANHGAAAAQGRFLLFLNNDTQVLGKWLQPMVEVFEKHKDTGLVGAKIVYPSGHLQEAGNRIDPHGNSVMIGLNDNPSAPRYNYLREVDYCSGVAIMIEAKLFNELKGFDELYAPCYYEDADLAYRVRKTGRKIFYQPATVICHHLSISTNAANGAKMKSIHKNRQKFLRRWQNELVEAHKVRLIAFYLPQFHTIPENDEWWGRGFTDWTNVKKAKPNFEGHCQPKEPGELGYYDLRDDKVRVRQIELAQKYGISAFCYYYYWFNGKKLLEAPLEMLLANKSLDFPFCICWANEDWTRSWDGESAHILIKQEYSATAYEDFIADIFPLFQDKRYLRINRRPVLLLYRAQHLGNCRQALKIWRSYCRNRGEDIYVMSVDSFGEATQHQHNDSGFDAIVEFPPHRFARHYRGERKLLNRNFRGHLYDYQKTSRNFINKKLPRGKYFRCAMPTWDNTARRQDTPHIFVNSTPADYQKWLKENISFTHNFFMGEEKISFINAWNEWGEGNYLEPDIYNKYSLLEATKAAAKESVIKNKFRSNTRIDLAVVIHAFYPTILPEILILLCDSPIPSKLFVSAPVNEFARIQKILEEYPFPYFLFPTNNKGRDILPFIKIMPQVIEEGYDFILKIHTKKSKHRVDGDTWRNDIYQKLLNPKSLKENTLFLKNNSRTGMVGPEGHIVPMKTYWGSNQENVLKLSKRMGVNEQQVMSQSFIAGTMFYARVTAITPLLNLKLKDDDFEDESGQIDGTMAHAIERLLAISNFSAGMSILSYDINHSHKTTDIITNDYNFAKKYT